MTHQPKLVELAERCEAATGPDRELDAAIAEAIGWTRLYRSDAATDEARDLWVSPDGGIERSCPRDYAASLDAAMTLVPEGWVWQVHQGQAAASGAVYKDYIPATRVDSRAATPALALCAAALRAMEERNA